ncbi:glycosyltransferase [Domibacillus indicus]|uniref:glycosyltransferase n=1 Tax=Domibacillus indicus TaxID=1437523 RepID=UPI000617BBB7|nr:glycosyltransferase [Domibacillus indicus]
MVKINVLYIAQKRPSFDGSTDQIRAYQQINSLLKRDYFVYCLFQKNDSICLVEGEELIHCGAECIYTEKTGSLYFAMLKAYLFKRYPLNAAQHSFPEIRRIIKHIRQEVCFDIIHIQSNMVHNFPDIDSWIEPVVVDYVDPIRFSQERRYRWTSQLIEKAARRGELGRVRKYESFLKKRGLNHIISPGADQRQVAPVTIEKLDIVPNYIEESLFAADLRIPKERAIIFSGPINEPEYADAAIRLVKDIYPGLKRSFPELKCWIVGTNPSPDIQKLLTEEGVSLIEEKERIRTSVSKAAAYVCPLRFGCGQKHFLLEAAAMGCPIILSHTANEGIEFISGKEAMLAETNEQFIVKTKTILSNQVIRLVTARQAQLFTYTFFSEKPVMNQLVNVYAKVIKQAEGDNGREEQAQKQG